MDDVTPHRNPVTSHFHGTQASKSNHVKDMRSPPQAAQCRVTSSVGQRVLPSDTSSVSGCSVSSVSGRCAVPQPPVQFFLGDFTSPQSNANSISPSGMAASQRSSLSEHRAPYCNPTLDQTPSPCPQRAHPDSTLDSSANSQLCGRHSVTSFSNRSSSTSGGAVTSQRAVSSSAFLEDSHSCDLLSMKRPVHREYDSIAAEWRIFHSVRPPLS